jgi:methionine-rich copper-binding protein CopC
MKRVLAIALLSTVFFGTSVFAVEPVVGNWKLNVAASKFSGEAPKSVTRSYSESPDGVVLHQKIIGADGKEMDMRVVTKLDGKDHAIEGNPDADTVAGKAIDARTSHFTMKRGGKEVGTVHRVVSADGKTLTVNNKGTHPDGKPYDDTLVFDKQ